MRYKFFHEKRLTTYLRYAIGEVILVMIGILLALQVNNWNESRKTRIKLKNSLIALKSDLAQDTILIKDRLPFINDQYKLNETLRGRVASPTATIDTLVKVMRFEFNPNWTVQVPYESNTYKSLNQAGLLESLGDPLNKTLKKFYSTRSAMMNRVEKTTNDYQGKVTSYVNRYTFGVTEIHDQGPLIDSLVWNNINYADLAATFQGISNFKRILFTETKEELEYSLKNSRHIIDMIDRYMK